MDIKQIMLKAMDDMPDMPNPAPLRFYASGPAMEARAREILGDMVEIVRTDRVEDAG
jgi:hypothetical protein